MNVLLVGPGGMGTVHYENYAHLPNVQVTALVGTSPADEQKAAQWKLPLFASVTQACQAMPIDLADICVPTFLHKTLALESIAQGKHTLVEKPIALCAQDAREMYAAAEKQGVQLYVAYVLQFTPEVETLRQVVQDERYGKPCDASFERLSACPSWSQGGWLMQKEKSGLIPYDLHIHDLDVIVSLFGKPQAVRFTTCTGHGRKVPEQYRFSYEYPGLTVNAEAAWFHACIPFTAHWRVYFDHGMLICDHTGLNGYDENGLVTVFDVEEKFKIPTGINLPPTGMFLKELGHFVDRAREERPSELVPKERVLAVMEVLEQVKNS